MTKILSKLYSILKGKQNTNYGKVGREHLAPEGTLEEREEFIKSFLEHEKELIQKELTNTDTHTKLNTNTHSDLSKYNSDTDPFIDVPFSDIETREEKFKVLTPHDLANLKIIPTDVNLSKIKINDLEKKETGLIAGTELTDKILEETKPNPDTIIVEGTRAEYFSHNPNPISTTANDKPYKKKHTLAIGLGAGIITFAAAMFTLNNYKITKFDNTFNATPNKTTFTANLNTTIQKPKAINKHTAHNNTQHITIETNNPIYYKIHKGDNLWKIAKRMLLLTNEKPTTQAITEQIQYIQEINRNIENHLDKKQQEALTTDNIYINENSEQAQVLPGEKGDGLCDNLYAGGKLIIDVEKITKEIPYSTKDEKYTIQDKNLTEQTLKEYLNKKIKELKKTTTPKIIKNLKEIYGKEEIQKTTPNKLKLDNIEHIVQQYNSGKKRLTKNKKQYSSALLDIARTNGRLVKLTKTYLEETKDSQAIKKTIIENYAQNNLKQLNEILKQQFNTTNLTYSLVKSTLQEHYGTKIVGEKGIGKRSKEQLKLLEQWKTSENLYKNLGQGLSSAVNFS